MSPDRTPTADSMLTSDERAMIVFRFSITYLMWLFLALLVDHYVRIV